MKQLSTKELERIISLYIDGELDPADAKHLQEYLTTHPAVAREVEILRTAQKTLASKEHLPNNDWFWLKLSSRIEEIESHAKKPFIVFRPAIVFSSLAAAMVLVTGVIFFKDAPLFHKFFIDKKNQVENVYRNNIMTGDILPLFSNLNKDDILNFALFGSIAIDSSNHTSLQVKNSEDKGSQIQIVKNDELHITPVTLNYFASEIGISGNQRDVVDSILGSYQEKLQASVLVSEHDEVAIHADLVDLNRSMVSTIAACLEPPQRTRFQKFLDTRKAPYAVVSINSPTVPSHVLLNRIPKMPTSNNYVIISPDSVEIAEMTINVDSIRNVARRHEMQYRKIVTERMVAELTERQRHLEENFVGMGQNRVRIVSSSGAFQIHFEHSAPAMQRDIEIVEMVRPRMSAPEPFRQMQSTVTLTDDSGFSFEIPADDQTVRVFKRLPKGEFRYEIVDSMMQEPKMKLMFRSSSKSSKRQFESKLRELKQREEELLDLDSLLRESNKQIDQTPARPKKTGKELDIELTM